MANRTDEIDEFLKAEKKPTVQSDPAFVWNGIVTAAVPVYVYHAIFGLSVLQNIVLYAVVTAVVALAIGFSYGKVANSLNSKLLAARDGLITVRSVEDEAKKRGEKAKAVWKRRVDEQQSVTVKEATAYSILYNNVLFLLATIVFGFFIFTRFSTPINFVLTLASSAALLAFAAQHS